MATVAITSSTTICDTPFLIKRYLCSTGTTAAALTHGGPAAKPSAWWVVPADANPTGADISVYSPTTTAITVDCEDDGNDTFYLFLLWTDKAAGGIS